MRARLAAGIVGVVLVLTGCSSASSSIPSCKVGADEARIRQNVGLAPEQGRVLLLAAQAVPSASILPCIASYPEGWTFAGSKASSGSFTFWLDSDRAGIHAAEVELTASCSTGSAVEVVPASDEAGTHRFEQPIGLPPNYAANRFYTFPGGCVEYRYRFHGTSDPALALEADQALSFVPRSGFVHLVGSIGLRLCGEGAPPCPGGETS